MNRDMERKQQIEALILKYEKTVYKLAYSYMRNRQDTDDIYQEVFLRFFRKKPEFESEEHEKAWFIRTTINCCKSYFLSGWVKRTMALEEQTMGREDSYGQPVSAFSDADGLGYLTALYHLGAVKGRGDGTFDLGGELTRQEAATFLARTYAAYGGELP